MVGGILGSLMVTLGFDASQFNAGAQNAGNIAQGLSRNLMSLVPSATVAAGALLGVGTAAINSARELQNFSRVANTGFETFQKWAVGSKTVGVQADKLSDILKDVNDKVGDYLTTGAGGMVDFFEKVAPKVGITAEAFRGLSGADALQLYISSLEKAGLSQAEMTFHLEAIASDATLLLPLLSNNGKEMMRLGAAAEKAGAIISDEMAVSLTRTGAAMDDLRTNTTGLKNLLIGEAAPGMERMAKAMSDMASSPFVRTVVGGLAANFDYLALGITTVASMLAGRFLSSLLVVNGAALTLSGTLGALSTLTFAKLAGGLVALAGGPLGLVLGAATLVGGALALWPDDVDDATRALEAHNTVMTGVRQKYIELNGEVKNWADVIANTTRLQMEGNLAEIDAGMQKMRKNFEAIWAVEMVGNRLGFSDADLKRLESLQLLFNLGALSAQEFKESLQEIAEGGTVDQRSFLLQTMTALDEFRPYEKAKAQAEAAITLTDDLATAADKARAEMILLGDEAVQSSIASADAATDANTAAIDALSNRYENHVLKLKTLGDDHRTAEKMLVDAIKAGDKQKEEAAKGYIKQIEEAIQKTLELGTVSHTQFDGIAGKLSHMTKGFSDYLTGFRAGPVTSVDDYTRRYIQERAAGAGSKNEEAVRAATAAAEALGVEVRDLLAVMSFESGIDPSRWGGAGGKYLGLIQFSPKNQQRYGIHQGQSIADQMPAVVQYLKDTGVKPGMAIEHIYAAILAGSAHKINASDRKNGGIVDNVFNDTRGAKFAGHINRAEALLAAFPDVVKGEEKRIDDAEKAAEEAERKAEQAKKKADREQEQREEKVVREAARIAQMRSEAVLKLVAEQEHYQATLGMTVEMERAWTAAKEAGMAQDKESVQALHELVLQTDALKRKQEEMRAVVSTIGDGFRDMWTGFLTGTKSAKEALGGLLQNLAALLANSAFNMLWKGTGQATGLEGAVSGWVNGIFNRGGGAAPAAGGGQGGGGFLGGLFRGIGGLFGGNGLFGGLGSLFNIGANANGTHSWAGGLTMVGEHGPELANLPRGTQIFDAQKTQRMMEGAGGVSRMEVVLSPELEARILEQARGQSIDITRQGIGDFQRHALPRHSAAAAQDPRRRG